MYISEDKIRKKIGKYRQQIISTICDLIAFPTANPPGQSYSQCVDYLSGRLAEWKIEHRIVSGPNGDYPRFSILGACGEGEDSLHFHGHYDVVPARTSEQFKPRLQEDRLYGRGSSDMKGGLAVFLFALRIIKELAPNLKGRITFAIVPDEETGGQLGTKYLIESGFLPRASFGMLMPEPTSGDIWNANKGAFTYRVEIKGKPAHVALEGQGVNAFEHMVEIAYSLGKLKKEIMKRKTDLPVSPPEADRSVMLVGGESGSGVNFNVVPEKAFFTIDRRINPEEKLEDARGEIMRVLNEHKEKGIEMEIELLQEGESSFVSSKTELALALKQSIIDITGREPDFKLCPGLCEIRFFNNRHIPAYAFGPGLLEVSHGPAEYVNIKDVLNCTEVYVLIALRLLSSENY